MIANMDVSTESCLIFGLTLDGHGGALPLTPEDDGISTTWLHGDYSTADAVSWLAAQGFGESAILALTRSDTRPRALKMGNGFLIVLRGVNLNPGADRDDMVSIRFWIESRQIGRAHV